MVQQATIRPTTKTNGLTYTQIVRGLRAVGLNENSRVIAHSSLAAFGYVLGGAQTMVGALTAVVGTLLAPAFTYQTLLIPKVGPADNGMDYGEDLEGIEFWRPDLPAHDTIGIIPNLMLKHPQARRSSHPALSFVGLGRDVESILALQTLTDPFAPLSWLADHGGDVLLLGVTQRTNTMIHVAEWRAGRPSFVRWSLTPEKIVEFKWPGDSAGFEGLTAHIKNSVVQGQIGQATVKRIPADRLVETAVRLIRQDSTALLCNIEDCERCRDMRKRVL